MKNTEIIFEVHEADEGGYWTKALGYDIFTEAETWEELKEKIRDAISCHFDDWDICTPITHKLF